MRTEEVEIYSDATNAAILRHPARRFPGILLQGDTLHAVCVELDTICKEIGRDGPGIDAANDLREQFRSLLNHYSASLLAHDIDLPFYEPPR